VVLGTDANPALGFRDPGRPAREQSSLGTARRPGARGRRRGQWRMLRRL